MNALEYRFQHRFPLWSGKAEQAILLKNKPVFGESDIVVKGRALATIGKKHKVFVFSFPSGRYAIFIHMHALMLEGEDDIATGVDKPAFTLSGYGPGPLLLPDDSTHILVFNGNERFSVIIDDAGQAILPNAVLRTVELDAVELRSGDFFQHNGMLFDFIGPGAGHSVEAPDAIFLQHKLGTFQRELHVLCREGRNDGGMSLIDEGAQTEFIDLPFLQGLSLFGF